MFLSRGTQGHFLLVSIPATWHTLQSVLDVDVGDGGREVRASFMGGEKASQYVTVEPASTPPLPFYMQGNKPRQGRPLAQGHLACNGRARAGIQDSELPVFLQALADHVLRGLGLSPSHHTIPHHTPAIFYVESCPSCSGLSLMSLFHPFSPQV